MPNSVLWVCLVAVWLFVLVPMVLKGRPQILKSTDAARKTRLLARGGTRTATAKTARRRSSGRHPHDPAWTSRRSKTAVTADDAESEDTDGKVDTTESAATTTRRVKTAKVEKPGEKDNETTVVDDADDTTADDTDAGGSRERDIRAEDESAEATVGDDADDEADEDHDVEAEADEYEDGEYEDSEYEDATDELDEDEYDDYARGSRHTDSVDESGSDEPEHSHDDRPSNRSAERSSRRNVYASDRDRELKYRERQRVTLGLFVLVILSVVAGVVLGMPGWIATGVTGLMLVGYLTYLRRAVKTEQQIRMQRLARAKRAQRAEEERRRREAATPEFAAAPPPPRLRRPGGAVVLEIDDEDPVFDHLPPFQRRRMEREDLQYRRVG